MEKIAFLSIVSFFILYSNSEDNNYSLYQTSQLLESIKRGAVIYQKKCARCHQENGEGKSKKYPPLAKSDFLQNNREESIRAIKFGLKGEIIVNNISYNKKMPKSKLNGKQVADVMNYISNSWGNSNKNLVSEEEVNKVLKN